MPPEFQVNVVAAGDQQLNAAISPMAQDDDGSFVLVWGSFAQDGDDQGVFGRRFGPTGDPLTDEIPVNQTTIGLQFGGSVTTQSAERFVVTWHGEGTDETEVWARRFSDAGVAMTDEIQLNTHTTGFQVWPDIARGAASDFVAVWQSDQRDGDGFGIAARRFAADLTPLSVEFTVNTVVAGAQLLPSVATDSLGNFVVVWYSAGADGSGFGIVGQLYEADGTPIGTEFPVNTFTAGDQTSPKVARNEDGAFVVVWMSAGQDGSGLAIAGRRFDSDGMALGDDFVINTITAGSQSWPDVGIDQDGGFQAIWHGETIDGSGSGIGARDFDASGAPLGPEYQVNLFTSSDQQFPAITVLPDGRRVTAWDSSGQDGGGFGVFGLSGTIFTDGFESGDVSAWSATLP